jgi:hypothetical protein
VHPIANQSAMVSWARIMFWPPGLSRGLIFDAHVGSVRTFGLRGLKEAMAAEDGVKLGGIERGRVGAAKALCIENRFSRKMDSRDGSDGAAAAYILRN